MGCNTRFPISMKITFLILLLLMFFWFQENEAKPAFRKRHHKKHHRMCGLTQEGDECVPGSRKYKKCCDRGLSCLPKKKMYTKIQTKKGKKAYKVTWIYSCQKFVLEEEEMEEERTNQVR